MAIRVCWWSAVLLQGRGLNERDAAGCRELGDTVTIYQSERAATVKRAYAGAGQPQHEVTEFIDDMAAALCVGECGGISFRRFNGERDRRRRVTSDIRAVSA